MGIQSTYVIDNAKRTKPLEEELHLLNNVLSICHTNYRKL